MSRAVSLLKPGWGLTRRMETFAEILGRSAAIEAVKADLRRLLDGRAGARRLPSILLQGETGTGKGLVARVIHRNGPRARGPFVDVNCAAIPETLIEAELFGFERGAFTDARRAKPGLFQQAHRGTIFLDEVGLLPETLQAKLLKVLEEHAVRRLGATASEPADAWAISATNTDLRSATRDGRFREDLYHRLAVVTLRLPPLRERQDDIVLLAEQFLAKACAEYGLSEKRFTPDACDRLLRYPWPGNIRELFNVVERLTLLGEGAHVTAEMLALPEAPPPPPPVDEPPIGASIDEAVRHHLAKTLAQTGWNISRTAKLLGISRNTLRSRIERFGLRADAPVPAPPRPAVHAPRPPDAPAGVPSAIRWESRRVTLLRAALVRSEQDAPSEGGRALELLVDKIQSFGGRVEELSPGGIGAVFGIEPIEDAPRRAAHAATAIQKAAERSQHVGEERFAVKVAIHVADVLVGQARGEAELDADTKRTVWSALEAMLERTPPERIVVSAEAARFLSRRFDLSEEGITPAATSPAASARARAGAASARGSGGAGRSSSCSRPASPRRAPGTARSSASWARRASASRGCCSSSGAPCANSR